MHPVGRMHREGAASASAGEMDADLIASVIYVGKRVHCVQRVQRDASVLTGGARGAPRGLVLAQVGRVPARRRRARQRRQHQQWHQHGHKVFHRVLLAPGRELTILARVRVSSAFRDRSV